MTQWFDALNWQAIPPQVPYCFCGTLRKSETFWHWMKSTLPCPWSALNIWIISQMIACITIAVDKAVVKVLFRSFNMPWTWLNVIGTAPVSIKYGWFRSTHFLNIVALDKYCFFVLSFVRRLLIFVLRSMCLKIGLISTAPFDGGDTGATFLLLVFRNSYHRRRVIAYCYWY